MNIFSLNSDDRKELLDKIRKGLTGNEIVRAMTLMLRAGAASAIETAEQLNINVNTVYGTCGRYEQGGIKAALEDAPRSGRPKEIDERTKTRIAALVCSQPPEAYDRWTLELIQDRIIQDGLVKSISKESIRIILKEHGYKPWQQKMWCIPELSPEYIERMEAILVRYDTPDNDAYPLVCIDEKSVQLQGDKRSPLLMREQSIRKVDSEYIRNGTANIFFAVEPYSGNYLAEVTSHRKGEDFTRFLQKVADQHSNAKKIHLVMDNLNTHNLKTLEKYMAPTEAEKLWQRFKIFYTPKHGSWLNQAEIAIGMYSRQCLGKTRIPDMETLQRKTAAWVRIINEKKVKINWTFGIKQARLKMNYQP
jgi:transposase